MKLRMEVGGCGCCATGCDVAQTSRTIDLPDGFQAVEFRVLEDIGPSYKAGDSVWIVLKDGDLDSQAGLISECLEA